MKKTITVNVGGICFTIDEDACETLKNYLDDFEASLEPNERKEVMEDVERRIAEIFQERVKNANFVVDETLVDRAISILGRPEKKTTAQGNDERSDFKNSFSKMRDKVEDGFNDLRKNNRRFYRNPDGQKVAGICSGIAEYFHVDVTLVRFLGIISLVAFGITAAVYLVAWFICPPALTSAEKLELRGLPITPENIRKYPPTERKK